MKKKTPPVVRKKKVVPIEFVSFGFGFAESAKICPMILKCELETLPTTEKEALQSVSCALFDKFMDDWHRARSHYRDRQCCKADMGKNFCSCCGRNLRHDEPVVEDFEDFLLKLTDTTVDSFGDELFGWTIPVSVQELKDSANRVIEVGEEASDAIMAALSPDGVDPEYKPVLEKWKEDLKRFQDSDEEEF